MISKAPEIIQPQQIELVLAQLDALGPLDPIAIQSLGPTGHSTNGPVQFVESIRSDLPLIAAVLAIAGGTEAGRRPDTLSVDDAVNTLGPDTIREITLVRKVVEAFGPIATSPNQQGFDRQAFWRHSLAVAIAAKGLAGLFGDAIDPQEAFACGWLHDIGKVALSALMPKSFARIVRQADEEKADIADVERGLLGIDHTVVGRRLAERWGLPSGLVDCIRLHHQLPEALPPSIAQSGQVHLVQLADTIAREQSIGYSGNHRMTTSSQELAERLGIPEADCREIADALEAQVEAHAAWIADEGTYAPSPYFLQALAHDTNELAKLNRRLLNMQGELLRTRNLETIVAMAAGAAHEMNSPLAVISGRAQMLRERTPAGEVRDMLDTITDRAQACSDIVTELMDFAQVSQPAPQRVDLAEMLHALIAELVSAGLLESDALRVEVSSDTPQIWFDPTWLNRIFKELFQNAINATQPLSRRLTVKATPHPTEDSVVVAVLDNGHGIPADVLGRVLDPFFSYRPAGRSRGLGLARVQRWLQLAGGAIRIESDLGCGTSVHLRLPSASPSVG